MDFQNLTPYPTHVLNEKGDVIAETEPNGAVALAAGDQLINLPPAQNGTIFIVLPAVTQASDRADLVSVELDEAERSHRGNVQTHICHWPRTGA